MANFDTSTVNARLKADPRYQAAKRAYDAAVAAAPPRPTVNDLRSNDAAEVAEGETRPEIIAAKQSLGKVVNSIVQEYGLPGQPQAWLFDPDKGQVVYEEDHSLRNIGIALGAIALAGAATAAYGGAAVPAATTPAAATGTGTLAATTTAPTLGALTTGGVASGAVPSALASGGAVVPAAATGGLGSLGWASLAANVGSQAVGAYLNARANNRATDAEAQANKDALDFTKEVYATERADSAPYRAIGANSVAALGSLMGFPSAQQAAQAQQGQPLPGATPTHIIPGQNFPSSWVPGSPFAAGGAQSAMVTMRKGDEVSQVPQKDVAHWQSLGAEVVSGPTPTAPVMPRAPQAPTLDNLMGGRGSLSSPSLPTRRMNRQRQAPRRMRPRIPACRRTSATTSGLEARCSIRGRNPSLARRDSHRRQKNKR